MSSKVEIYRRELEGSALVKHSTNQKKIGLTMFGEAIYTKGRVRDVRGFLKRGNFKGVEVIPDGKGRWRALRFHSSGLGIDATSEVIDLMKDTKAG